MKKNTKISTSIVSLATTASLVATVAISPVFVSAAIISTGVNVKAKAAGTSVSVRAAANATTSATKMGNEKTRADAEIARRITTLGALSTRINGMAQVSADEKTSLSDEIQTQVSDLNAVKTKIDADTSTTTIITDSKTITDSYRIYMLVVPQTDLIAASDRIQTITSIMTTIGTKFQTRITQAQTSGKDTTSLQATISDYNGKIADANVQAQAAYNGVVSLKPDQGNTTIEASNKAALVAARSKIKLATADLKAARTDADTVLKALKSFEVNTNVSAAASTTTQ